MANVFIQTTVKPWYNSKIVLFCMTALFVFAGIFVTQSGITPAQVDVIATSYPDVADAIKEYKINNNLFALLGTFVSVVVAVLRVWFTKEVIPQSLPISTEN